MASLVKASEDLRSRKKDTSGFIYVPSIDLYVSKQKRGTTLNWFESHELLQRQGERMLTILEFVEFLKYIKSSNDERHLEIYNDIIEEGFRGERSEYLDARFQVKKRKLHINYGHRLNRRGNLIPQNSEVLDKETYLGDERYWGEKVYPTISLDDYIDSNHTNQGLPTKDVGLGNLNYDFPNEGYENPVAGFIAGGNSSINLICGLNPKGRSIYREVLVLGGARAAGR